jgi:2-iminobutanoate/2-iminopropanoate deaminase
MSDTAMLLRTAAIAAGLIMTMPATTAEQATSPTGVKTLSPDGAIKPTGTWSLGTRAGDFIFVAGMRGIDPETNTLVAGDEARIRQAFLNMKLIAESEGAGLTDAVRIVVYVTDMFRFRPLVNKEGSIPAAHHRGGRSPQSGRHIRGGGDLLRSRQEVG